MFLVVLNKQVSVEKFEGFDPNLLKNLHGSFLSRAPGSLRELSLHASDGWMLPVVLSAFLKLNLPVFQSKQCLG